MKQNLIFYSDNKSYVDFNFCYFYFTMFLKINFYLLMFTFSILKKKFKLFKLNFRKNESNNFEVKNFK